MLREGCAVIKIEQQLFVQGGWRKPMNFHEESATWEKNLTHTHMRIIETDSCDSAACYSPTIEYYILQSGFTINISDDLIIHSL